MDTRVANEDLVRAGLALMSQNGMPLERVQAKGRAMIYRTSAGETVRVRTCNDHVLVVLADTPDQDARLNIEGTDHLLVVMPEAPRTVGNVVGYLVPTSVAVDAARTTHADWLASNPSTKGQNRTWNIWFDDDAPEKSSGFARKWARFRLAGSASTHPPALSTSIDNKSTAKLGEVIADAKRRIAEAAGVPESAVKISVDLT